MPTRPDLTPVAVVRRRDHHYFPRLVANLAQQATHDLCTSCRAPLGLAPFLALDGVACRAHRLQALVRFFKHYRVLQFFLISTPGSFTSVFC